jgi:hypothetical protein
MRSGLVFVLLAAGCVAPRSLTVGQMAAPVGRGATEVGVFGGILYGSQTDPALTDRSQTIHRVFGAPTAEANVQHGFNDTFALNLHASNAGLEPGLKVTLNRSRVAHVALLPAFGLGYGSYASSTLVDGGNGLLMETAPSAVTSFTFLAGLKVLVSHRSGFFAGVGYDLLYNRSLSTQDRGGPAPAQTLIQSLTHQVSASVGFDFVIGSMVHLRPEVAFAVYPGGSKTIATLVPPANVVNDGGAGGFGFAILPGLSIAVASPVRELTDDEREEEKAAKPKRRKSDGESDDDDEDEAPKAKRSRSSDDD